MHRVQGMTLDYVQVDLENTFTSGQAYVALSRTRDFRNLKVLNFKEEYVKPDSEVFAHNLGTRIYEFQQPIKVESI